MPCFLLYNWLLSQWKIRYMLKVLKINFTSHYTCNFTKWIAFSQNLYSLLGEGSTATLVDEYIASRLNATGETNPLAPQWMNNTKRCNCDSQQINIIISRNKETHRKNEPRIKNLALQRSTDLQDLVNLTISTSNSIWCSTYSPIGVKYLIRNSFCVLLFMENPRRKRCWCPKLRRW